MFIFLFFISTVSSLSLSIYPSKLSFNLSIGDKSCQDVFLDSDYGSILLGSDVWNSNKSNFLNSYNLSSEELNIEISYPQNVSIINRTQIEVCIIPDKKGKYYGALLYKIDGKPFRTGTWIELNVEGNDLIKITGNSIVANDFKNNFLIIPILLALVLIGLAIWNYLIRKKIMPMN